MKALLIYTAGRMEATFYFTPSVLAVDFGFGRSWRVAFDGVWKVMKEFLVLGIK
jgi:hypothetical protein